jgi:manganese transport protein
VNRVVKKLLSFGPGIFAIGYTIGTGSVTSMIVAGNQFGMQLLWVLLLSCIFTGVLVYASGHYYLRTGETFLHGVKNKLKGGRWLAIAIIVTVGIGQWNSLIGILGITSNVIYELLLLYYSQASAYEYVVVLVLATLIIGLFYRLLLSGNYANFEQLLGFFVSIMGLSFVLALVIVRPAPVSALVGLVPSFPAVEGAGILVAAFVGTTMAAATFVSRPLFIQGKGWTQTDEKIQRRDAIFSAILIFTISGSIMAVASAVLHGKGHTITHVLDMSAALEPVVGKFAVSIFFAGTLSAGLSSIFPCLMIVPLMISDYSSGQIDVKSSRFKWITGIASLLSLSIPLFGFNPIKGQIFTQVFNVFGLPLVVMSLIFLWNRSGVEKGIKKHVLTVMMLLAFIFSIIIMSNALIELF